MTTPAELLSRFGSPLYVYDEAELRRSCRALRSAVPLPGVDILYAMKANANPALLAVIRGEGLGIDAVSEGEVRQALKAGFPAERIAYNGNNVTDAEMRAVGDLGVEITVDSLSQLEHFGRLFPGRSAGIRVNPDVGSGHHDHVITGGPESKFGIDPAEIPDALAIAARHRVTLDVLQHHIGSGILDEEPLFRAMDVLLEAAAALPALRTVDFGGGFGVAYRPEERPLDLQAFGFEAAKRLDAARGRLGSDVAFRFEPGRAVVATSGTLYVTVTAVKRARRHTFAGTDSGFNHLVRPAMYGSFHAIENVSNPDGPVERVSVAGNICESGDLFAKDRPLPRCREGDVLAIRDAGAYGWSMASTYNLRPRPAEVLLSETGEARLVRPRDPWEALLG